MVLLSHGLSCCPRGIKQRKGGPANGPQDHRYLSVTRKRHWGLACGRDTNKMAAKHTEYTAPNGKQWYGSARACAAHNTDARQWPIKDHRYPRPHLSIPPTRDDGSPLPEGGLLPRGCQAPHPPWTPPQTKDPSAHTVPTLWPVACCCLPRDCAHVPHQRQGWTDWLQQAPPQDALHVWVQVWALVVPPAFWGSTFSPGCPG